MSSLHPDENTDEEDVSLASGSRKRSSRACDQCRKTKSKCERSPDSTVQCKSCILAGTSCTFLGPSYKRGPPKGYIRAIEQRWHQVEALLGAILQCSDPQVQNIVSTLREDDLSREILHRVDNGPYGPSGRLQQPTDATKEDFFASIMRSNERPSTSSTPQTTRSRRQSRLSREHVSSNQDDTLSMIPTPKWQDSISSMLSTHGNRGQRLTTSRSYDELSGQPLPQRRRFNGSWVPGAPEQPDLNDMYTMEDPGYSSEESAQEATQFLGHLSLDEHSEMRYHGNASGMHLLSRHDRTDDRIQGGIWQLPMARVWPPSKLKTGMPYQEDNVDEQLPPVEVQDHLLSLYFTHIHPTFPVLNKRRFLQEYNLKKHDNGLGDDMDSPSSQHSSLSGTPRPESSQKVSKFLLFSMFAVSSRFDESSHPPPPPGKMWEAGFDYLVSARSILTKVFHLSKATTVQALLVLGHRDFGMGSMEAAWANIGLAIRMAIDLGLNLNAEKWKLNGVGLFSPDEVQTRRHIWWACLLADRYGSMYMGRPICIRDADFDLPHPAIDEQEDRAPWTLLHGDPPSSKYTVSPCMTSSCFNAVAKLIVIIGSIVTDAYPVRRTTRVNRKTIHSNLETSLDQWYIDLPEELRVDTKSNRSSPPPHILTLHIRYWGAVLLLHRAFVPNWKGPEQMSLSESNAFSMKAFDLAQAAATQLSAVAALWRETFTLKRSSPFLTSYVLNAGIMHILTLRLRPANPSAIMGLRQCLDALQDMSITWPSAARGYELLDGVNLGFEPVANAPTNMMNQRPKRDAEDAFGAVDLLPQPSLHPPRSPNLQPQGIQDLNQRMMAHMLGFDIPGMQPNTSFLPGYSEWWPKHPHHHPHAGPSHPNQSSSLRDELPMGSALHDGIYRDDEHNQATSRSGYGLGRPDIRYGGGHEDMPWISHNAGPSHSQRHSQQQQQQQPQQHPPYYGYTRHGL